MLTLLDMTQVAIKVYLWNSWHQVLTAEVELWAGAQWVDDVDDQAVGGGPEGQRPGGYQQGHHMEQIGQVGRNIQGVVEGQHEHVACQDGDVIPH